MKKSALVLACSLAVAAVNAQPVFTFGKNSVSKTEFIRAFDKNPVNTPDRQKALKEYLDLYINFRLKVQAAYDAGLDKDQTQLYELQNFRRQIAENILNEKANLKELVKEAFIRSQKDIHLAHVFVEVPAKGDTAAAYKKIQEAYKALQQGKSFEAVAAEYSSDPGTIQSKGDLGFITVFTLPYEFENIAYNIKPNTYSAPVRTSLGYHIFKNKAERTPLGTRRVAQILIAFPPNGSEAEKTAAKRKADSVYNLIAKGQKFEDLVAQVSNDMSSNYSAGQLPEFGIGTYNPVFEQQAFALTNPNDITQPFATTYGYHILKLLEAKPIASDTKDDIFMAQLQEKVSKDGRLLQARKQMLDKQLSILKYKPAAYNQADLFAFTDSNVQKTTSKAVRTINEKSVLFSFGPKAILAGDWLKFVRAVNSTPNEFSGKDYPTLMKDYVRVTADEFYRDNLEKYSVEFDRQVKEFKDANLLFGIMDKQVWSKANEDTSGLKTYFSQNKAKYKWAPSADAIIVTCTSATIAEEVAQKLQGNLANWRTITDAYGTQVTADSGRYELSQLPIPDRTNFTAGLITAPLSNQSDGSTSFNLLVKIYRDADQRSFEDARGMVISDYQQVLEERWLAELKKKYPVKVNQAVVKTLK
ncbi:peptidylprolyl isomerase [Aridibaculum aurantiacum]|uniref:peptidylprolyl isomerase n=1 Tax=Aridibaculum aurantiacum TaxID=2810307 RepID=UPI001A97CE07|nr:peptidylprolyl isomerase [Aridibaculum aurantiacum]